MFSDKLKEYRKNLNLNKRQMASNLKISESYYNLIESSKRTPSNKVLDNLVLYSKREKKYWLYDIDPGINLKNLDKIIKQLVDLGILKEVADVTSLFNENYTKGTIEELIVTALKKDIEKILQNKSI